MKEETRARIIGSCGHELKDVEGNFISFKDIDRMGERCTVYKTVCDECAEWYQKEMGAKLVNQK